MRTTRRTGRTSHTTHDREPAPCVVTVHRLFPPPHRFHCCNVNTEFLSYLSFFLAPHRTEGTEKYYIFPTTHVGEYIANLCPFCPLSSSVPFCLISISTLQHHAFVFPMLLQRLSPTTNSYFCLVTVTLVAVICYIFPIYVCRQYIANSRY